MLSWLHRAWRHGPRRLPLILMAAFAAWFIAWAIHPAYLQDFILEHILTAALLLFLVRTYRRHRLSNLSYSLILAFMCLHVVGAHYTYSEVPLNDWVAKVAAWFGIRQFHLQATLGLTRNHYDRLVHLMFGLLITFPIRELIVRIVRLRGGWSYGLPLAVMLSLSTSYELIEWAVALVFGADIGQAYLGTQGDEWDAQKDMALAAFGSVVASLLIALADRTSISQRPSSPSHAQ
jgi:putative membrane protein